MKQNKMPSSEAAGQGPLHGPYPVIPGAAATTGQVLKGCVRVYQSWGELAKVGSLWSRAAVRPIWL